MSLTTSPESWRINLSPLHWRHEWLRLDQNESAIAFVSTFRASALLHFAFFGALMASFQLSKPAMALIALTLSAMLLFPARRLEILVGSSLFYFALRPFRIEGWQNLVNDLSPAMGLPGGSMGLQVAAVGVTLVLSMSFLAWQRAARDSMMAKRPLLSLIIVWSLLLILALGAAPGTKMHALLWSIVGVFISSLWVLAYSAGDQLSKDTTSNAYRGAFLRPFWGGSAAPIGKSFGYLNKFAAKDEADLAITRIKALKLIVWTVILSMVLKASQFVIHDLAGLPILHSLIVSHANGAEPALSVSWASLIANYFIDLLIISVWGHAIVATVRMAGYRIPRNTHNPLASRTLAEFWNRYFFYFKEMLVDFFFYPAFRRYFKTNLKVRIAFATLCAAGLGNFLYHFMRETYVFADGNILSNLWVFQSAAFYSIALAAGLMISQWRNRKVMAEDGFFKFHVWPRVNVIAFFCFLKIFDDISGEGTFSERVAFSLSLFGV